MNEYHIYTNKLSRRENSKHLTFNFSKENSVNTKRN